MSEILNRLVIFIGLISSTYSILKLHFISEFLKILNRLEIFIIIISAFISLYECTFISESILYLRNIVNSLISLVKYNDLKDITKITNENILNELIDIYTSNQSHNIDSFGEKYPNIDINSISKSFNNSQYNYDNGKSSLEFRTKGAITQELYNNFKSFAIITIALFICSFVSKFLVNHVFSNVSHRMRSVSYKSILKAFPRSYYSSQSYYSTIIEFITNNSQKVEELGKHYIINIVRMFLMITSLIFGCNIEIHLFLLLYFICLIFIIVYVYFSKHGVGCYLEKKLKSEKNTKILSLESFNNIKIVNIYGREEIEIKYFNENLKLTIKEIKRKIIIFTLYFCFTLIYKYILYMIVFEKGSKYINNGILKGGDIFAIILYLYAVGVGSDLTSSAIIREINDEISNISKVINDYEKAFKNDSSDKPKVLIQGNIELLNNHIQPGKTVTLTYDTNYNKNKILKSILNVKGPFETNFVTKIDGHNVEDYNPYYLRSQIGFVPDKMIFFNDTIAENIKVRSSEITQQQIEDAAKLMNIHDLISQLPKGYQTNLIEDNIKLTVDEKLRICFARALVNNPKILIICSEVIDDLDEESRNLVESILDKYGSKGTIIKISKKQKMNNTIKNDKEKITKSGTQEELTDKQEDYYNTINKNEVKERLSSKNNSLSDLNEDELDLNHDNSSDTSTSNSSEMDLLNHKNKYNSDGHQKKSNKNKNCNGLLKYIQKLWFYDILLFIGSLLLGSSIPFIGIIFGYGIYYSTKVGKELIDSIHYWTKILLLLGLCTYVFGIIHYFGLFSIRDKMEYYRRKNNFKSMIYQDMSYFDNNKISSCKHFSKFRIFSFIPNLYKSIFSISSNRKRKPNNQMSLISTIGLTVNDKKKSYSYPKYLYINEIIGSIVVCFIYSFINHKSLTLYLFIYFIMVSIFASILNISEALLNTKQNDDYKKIINKYVSNLNENDITYIKGLNMNHRLINLINQELEKYQKRNILKNLIFSIYSSFYAIFNIANITICLYIGYRFYSKGQIDFLTMITIVLMVAITCKYVIDNIFLTVDGVMNGIKDYKDILNTLNKEPKIDSKDTKGIRDDQFKGKITLKNVFLKNSDSKSSSDFIVRTGKEEIVIPEGKTVAFVGESNEVTTRLLGLIPRWYDAEDGEVLIDDRKITDYNVKWLREQISYIGEWTQVFDTCIEGNIGYGKEDATEEEIEEAAKRAGIHDTIIELPLQYEASINSLDYENFKRIEIARAIIRHPKILLLDRPLSRLKQESKIKIKELLKDISKDCTTIIATDNVSLIQDVDMIAVINYEGKVVEIGNHEELMNLQGEYYKMVSN